MKNQTKFKVATWATTGFAMAIVVACGGGDGSSADASGASQPSPSTGGSQQQVAYVNWTNSANGEIVKDFANHNFKVQASDGTVVNESGIKYNTAIVNTKSGSLVVDGQPAGAVAPVTSSAGTQIAAFFCMDGSGLVWAEANGKFSYNCMSERSGQTSGASGSGTTTQGDTNATFRSWSGSINGDIVLDASNDQFKVRSDGALLLQGVTVLNGAVVQGTTLTINGSKVGSVALIGASSGGQVAVLVCDSGGRMDLSTNGSTYTYNCSNRSDSGPAGGGGSNSTPAVQAQWSDVTCSYNGGVSQLCVTNVKNTGSARISCQVQWNYRYAQDGKLVSDYTVRAKGPISPGATAQIDFQLSDRNYEFVSAQKTCQLWELD